MATKFNKGNNPLDPQTPSKVLCAAHSASRSQTYEHEDSANHVTPSTKDTSTSSTRRSTRILVKKISDKIGENEDVSDVKILDNEKLEDDVPLKKFFNENPDDHVHGYSFRTPNKRDMEVLACNTSKTPRGATTKLQKYTWLYRERESSESSDSEVDVEKISSSSSEEPPPKPDVSDVKILDDEKCEYVPPKNFFNKNPDDHVHGYSFKTPKKTDGMLSLAGNTPKTQKGATIPRTPKTTKSPRKIFQHKTPSNVRAKLQKGLRKREDHDEDEDDYEPSESSDSDVDVEKVSSSSSEDTIKPTAKTAALETLPGRRTKFSAKQQQDVVFESDKYFSHTNRKNATSDNTLDSLKTPRLQHEDMFKLLANHHQNCMHDLHNHYETFFPKWLFILKEGFSILLHGLGSKRNILETLHKSALAKENVLVVNGYFPSLSIKDILDGIVTGLLETTCKSKNLHEIVDAIEEEMNLTPDYHIFLIVHNLDGSMLRNEMAQNIISRLAHIDNLHLIASIDHINAPTLWDNIQISNYNFSWWDVTSFLPYTDETSVAENSMLLTNSGALTIASMNSVLLSLTQNARGIYMKIVENQLASTKTTNYQGMPFKNLYKKCLENFLVSSDIVLRTQLTEFCDQNLLKVKRTADGMEQLQIPIGKILLQQFVEQYNNWQREN